MNATKLNQIITKVNELLNGADDCFNDAAGYVIFSDEFTTMRAIRIMNPVSLTESNFFEIQILSGGAISVTRQGLDEDQVIELLNK